MSLFIKEIYIENFKRFQGGFNLTLNPNFNILVGNNEAGKSTILEAINLALTGMLGGRYLKNELSQHLFNNQVVLNYIDGLASNTNPQPPQILIELFFSGEEYPLFKGDKNHKKINECGLALKIAFDERYNDEYEALLTQGNLKTIPIEYYDVSCYSFARESITPKSIPIKPAFIDSSTTRFQNGSDIYISRIIKDLLDTSELVNVAQAYRKARETFASDSSISTINTKIKTASKISEKNVKIDIDLPSKNAWETAVMTYLDDVPFHFIGKGEQCVVKTKLALGHQKAQEANIILLEEPENHLSHTKLNGLVKDIKDGGLNKQIIITTHSSFVANKLGLENIILLNGDASFSLKDLPDPTRLFFNKLSGYDTLRLVLCKKAILVEGDSDELVVQRAYMDIHNGKLPIEDGIDVISVGTSFLRFLEVAHKINKPVSVVTDNDGSVDSLKRKYTDYLGEKQTDAIKICFDNDVASGSMTNFNYNTLEPTLLRANDRTSLNKIFGTNYPTDDELLKYMHGNKTLCAIKIFEALEKIEYPQYIKDAII